MDIIRYIIYDLGFVTSLFVLASFFLFIGIKLKKKPLKLSCFYFSTIPITLVLFELTCNINQNQTNTTYIGTYNDNEAATGKKDFLGYGPKEDTTFKVSLIIISIVLLAPPFLAVVEVDSIIISLTLPTSPATILLLVPSQL